MAFCYLEQHRVAVLEDKCKALELEKESILASNIQVCIVLHFGIKRNPVEIIFKSHVRLFLTPYSNYYVRRKWPLCALLTVRLWR